MVETKVIDLGFKVIVHQNGVSKKNRNYIIKKRKLLMQAESPQYTLMRKMLEKNFGEIICFLPVVADGHIHFPDFSIPRFGVSVVFSRSQGESKWCRVLARDMERIGYRTFFFNENRTFFDNDMNELAESISEYIENVRNGQPIWDILDLNPYSLNQAF